MLCVPADPPPTGSGERADQPARPLFEAGGQVEGESVLALRPGGDLEAFAPGLAGDVLERPEERRRGAVPPSPRVGDERRDPAGRPGTLEVHDQLVADQGGGAAAGLGEEDAGPLTADDCGEAVADRLDLARVPSSASSGATAAASSAVAGRTCIGSA
jgi:hypothetical protein